MTTGWRHVTIMEPVGGAPANDLERALAAILGDLVGTESPGVNDDFFDTLGADSMVMARFCARVRKLEDVPSVSMKEVYAHPTIRRLAAAVGGDEQATARPAAIPVVAAQVVPGSTRRFVLCGAIQLGFFLGYLFLMSWVLVLGYDWMSGGEGLLGTYGRTVAFGGVVALVLVTMPILAKWLLIGRWRPTRIQVWTLAYARFWIVRTLVQRNPMVRFVGSPLFVLYLRALGARIGPGAVLLSRRVPLCTDLLTVGAGAVIRKDTLFTGYRAEAGVIETGPVTIGAGASVGDAAVLDIDTVLGDGARLAHASSLHRGQRVPAGECWSGTPASREQVDAAAQDSSPGGVRARIGSARRFRYGAAQLALTLLVRLPLAVGAVILLFEVVPALTTLMEVGSADLSSWAFFGEALAASFVLCFGPLLVALVIVGAVPRLFHLALRPDRHYPLYGLEYALQRSIERLSSNRIFPRLFGDSSMITGYLRWLGYDLSTLVQTGSNFGSQMKQENPFLCTIGSGTMVADGLSMINCDYTATSFRLSRARVGAESFLGNHIIYPSAARVGDNCLIGTKAMVPVSGELRENAGLLGSPSFPIPRTVLRDHRFDHLGEGEALARNLAAKNKHNATTLAAYLAALWAFVFELTIVSWTAAALAGTLSFLAAAAVLTLSGATGAVLRVLHFVVVERLSTRWRDLEPLYCSIYDRRFWQHERYWKSTMQPTLLDGTPFKALAWRLLGVRVGRRLFDDGAAITERTLTRVGDDCTLNIGAILQAHSQEDGSFKSDRIELGDGCTVGVNAWVHYGVTMGADAVLAADSFLMKGEDVPSRAVWTGNPARAAVETAGSAGLTPAAQAPMVAASPTSWSRTDAILLQPGPATVNAASR